MQTNTQKHHQNNNKNNHAVAPQVLKGYLSVFLLMGAGYALHMLPASADRTAQRIVAASPTVVQVLLAAGMIWCVMQIKSSDIQPFIYFQF